MNFTTSLQAGRMAGDCSLDIHPGRLRLRPRAKGGTRCRRSRGARGRPGRSRDRAPVELNNARTKLQRAQDAASRSRHEEAARLAREAEADAQLASAKSQSAAANSAVTQIRQTTSTLQEEVQRQTVR